jgi:3-methyladenine DNA glycosylase AlkD
MMEEFEYLINICDLHADPLRAKGMKAYMKDRAEYFGISSPLRKELIKTFKTEFKLSNDSKLWDLVELLWKDEHREMQYIALDILRPFTKKMNCEQIPILENMIVTKSWWDTVDSIAPNLVGLIFKANLPCRDQYVYKWIDSDNMWLQRSAIIFQLKYGKDTDVDLLLEAILKHDDSKEFFIRKAQGWALRQYSKIDPELVRQFIEANPQLSGLMKREALRLIGG